MSTRKYLAEDRKKWIQALWVAIVTLAGLILLGFLSISLSAWMPILFCWGGIMVFSAIPIIWMSMSANQPFPEIGQWGERIPWAVVGGLGFFVMFMLKPSYYSGEDWLMELSCFGVLFGFIGFIFSLVIQRATLILLLTMILPFVWLRLFQDDLMVMLFTIGGIATSVILYFTWDRIRLPRIYNDTSQESKPFDSIDALKAAEKETLHSMKLDESDLADK